MANMQVVSSRWTLTLKLLLPMFWFCFFGGATIIMFFMSLDSIGEPFTPMTARLTMLTFVLSTAGLYYLMFSPIKWVAMDEEKLYVSNFQKSYQYTYDSVAKIEEQKILFWNRITIHFHETTQFGSKIVFLGSYYWYYFLKKNPAVLKQLLPPELIENLD